MAPGDPREVGPLTHFRSVCFLLKEILDLRGTQINEPSFGRMLFPFYSLPKLPHLSLGPMKGFPS